MNFLFLMDPLSTVVMEKDTSFAFMLAAHRRGHKIFFITDGDIFIKNGLPFFHALEVIPQRNQHKPFIEKKLKILSEKEAAAIFVRSDPPFDYQ